jgi:glycosyltransferase involved in cell wall biosynthesis
MKYGLGVLPTESFVIIVPLFNESTRWNSKYWDKFKKPNLTLIFIDDGSTDNTWKIISDYAPKYSYRLDRNIGKAQALQAGFDIALNLDLCPNYIGFLDADRAFDPGELIDLISDSVDIFRDGFDSVWAARVNLLGRNINRKRLRHLIGRVINSFLSISYKGFPYDSQCGFKMYKVDNCFRKSLEMKIRTRWFFEVEHLANYSIKNNKKMRIWEQPLESWHDTAGSKLYRVRSLLIVIEIMRIFYFLKSANKMVMQEREISN